MGLAVRQLAGELDGATLAITRANAAEALSIRTDSADDLRAELALHNLRGPAQVQHWWNGLTDAQHLA